VRGTHLQDVSVLVVNENMTNRAIFHHLLTSWGMRQRQASSAMEALALMQTEAERGMQFDVAIIDMQMPGMNGLDLVREIKRNPRIASTRLIMLTAFDHRDDPEMLRANGVDACLVKPVKQSPLLDCLNSVMGANFEMPMSDASLAAAQRPAGADLKLRILVAEDNAVNQKVASYQLQQFGCTADVVENGRLAIEAMGRTNYDIVFMDCQMPELDGYAATHAIRSKEGTARHTWIVAMTANSLEGDREKCLAAGMDDYVSKPVKPGDLRAALARFKEGRDAKAAPVEPVESALVAPAADGAVDLSLLAGFREMEGEGGVNLLENLIGVFLENAPQDIGEARVAMALRSAQQVERAAHKLKGSCSNFGAERMRAACLQLEQTARAGSLEKAPELLAAIEREFNQVRLALERERPACAA
jgi:CheY-like chemotaxis protein/HPt (histidine-containing phosphotransfer) domain-containing protein